MVAAEATENELVTGTQVLNRYSIVGKLAQGGMAEVYLARQVGPAGYQKLVVIKRVRPHLANDDDFVGMFVNEARLAAMINHPNVVQIFDLGDEPRPQTQGGGQDWFLAMEYLDGRDMLQVGRACRAHNKAVPFDVTARIIADACAGLDHAHGLRGPDGKSLGLVHRDMSPENILITFEGQVKVVDFGIAKASDNLIKTQAGQIKGKLGYVAPEAILGKAVDARADVFAIGATLYLFLSGRPAFSGANPMEVFEKSLKPPVPPREVNSRVPEGLDAICMKALAQDRDKRYGSAGEVRAALDAYLQSTGRPLGPVQLSQFMRILFPPDKDPVRQRIDKFLAEAPPPVEAPRRNTLPPGGVPAPLAVELAPAYVDDDKTNIVPPRPEPSAPDPITINVAKPDTSNQGPAHLRSMGVPGLTSQPSSAAVGEMTNEDIDMRAARAEMATLQTSAPTAAPSIDIDDIDMDDLAAEVADDEGDLATVKVSSPQMPPRQPTMQTAMDDVVSAIQTNLSDDDMGPPPPMEPSLPVSRPASSSAPPAAPPPSWTPEPPQPMAAEAAPPAFSPSAPQPPPAEPAPTWAPPVEAMPAEMVVAAPGPSLGLRLAMLFFGFLTGAVLIAVFLVASGLASRL